MSANDGGRGAARGQPREEACGSPAARLARGLLVNTRDRETGDE